jgi:hypothetical protein
MVLYGGFKLIWKLEIGESSDAGAGVEAQGSLK